MMNRHWNLTLKVKLVAVTIGLIGGMAATQSTYFEAKAAKFTSLIASRVNGASSKPRLNIPASAPTAIAPVGMAAPAMVNMMTIGCATPSFSAASNFVVGTNPFSVVVGDFNLDGLPDIATSNIGTNNVSVLLGNGTGGFGAVTNFAVGSLPNSIAVGDFNRDGKPDLATANVSANNVSVLLGDGLGGFAAATNFAVGSGPFYVTVGDFNLDGFPDLVAANGSSNNVSVLLGNGMGGFGAATNFAVGTNPQSVAVGDFNGDGKPDMAVANVGTKDVSVLLGNGMGGFGAATNFVIGSTSFSVAKGDFNIDGKTDLVTANASSNNVSVLLGDGMGGFGAATNFSAGNTNWAVVVGDFNSDGKPDLVTVNNGSNNVSVLLGDGMGGFGAPTNFGAGTNPIWIAVGDFNLDGKPDLVTANGSVNNISILLNTCNGTPCGGASFDPKTDLGTGTNPFSVAVGDFNLDGKPDLAVVNEGVNSVSVRLGNGAGSFGAATSFTVGSTPVAVVVGDFNNDGKPDLAVANTGSNSVSVLLGNGVGSFGAATNFGTGSGPFSVSVGDFNLDGKLDLATPNGGSNNVSVLLGTGTGSFGAKTDFAVGTNPQSVGVGDFNRDGKPDMAVANVGSNNISVRLGDGAGGFGAPANIAVGNVPISVAVGDFNRDGKGDLAVANANSNNVSVLLGNGMGGFAAPANFVTGTSPILVAVGDFNLDGRLDFVTANSGSSNVSVRLGNGMGSFAAATNFAVGSGPLWVAVGDFNLDGRLDIVTANASVNSVSVLLNNCMIIIPPPTLTKAFAPTMIALNGTSSLSFTITNNSSTSSLTGIGFTDPLPAGLVVSTPNGLSKTCAGTVTATAGAGTIDLAGGTLAAGGTCTITVNVTGTTAGIKNNTTGAITSTETGIGATSNTSTVTVDTCPTITLNPATLVAGSTGTPYSQSLTQTGGSGMIAWSVSVGSLPANLALNPATGAISGTPVVDGAFNFTIRATDANNCFGERAYSLQVTGFEADVAQRPYGSGTMTVADWVQGGRFSVGLDTPGGGTEFQRADCAPRGTLGDGQMTVADWVQAGRYAIGLDPQTTAGGPSAPIPMMPSAGQLNLTAPTEGRVVRAINAGFTRGRIGTMQVEFDALGNENALSFTVIYDPQQAVFIDAAFKERTNEATLLINANQASKGRVAIAMAMSVGKTFTAGSHQLLTLHFIPTGGEGRSSMEVKFDDSIVSRELVNTDAMILAQPQYVSSQVVIDGSSAAIVSAASYENAVVASESIATVFGRDLAARTESARTDPLPLMLGGSKVRVTDSEGVDREASLYYASPGQINFQIPKNSALGPATVTISNASGTATAGLIEVVDVAPGIFTTDDGMAAANLIRGSEDQIYLALFGTGWRNLKGQSSIKVRIDGIEAQVLYSGAQGTFTGLDQINILLPPYLAGKREVGIEILVDGIPANIVRYKLR